MKQFYLILVFILAGLMADAQICTNSTDSIYSLNSITGSGSGQIVAVNVNNAGTKLIGSPASSSEDANGMGFSAVNGRFYFFNRSSSGVTEFVSFNPLAASGAKVVLANPPFFPTNQKIRSGTVNKGGSSYYTIFPGATTAMGFPVTGPAFYHYGIGTGTWTLITQQFRSNTGTIIANITSLNSGDMAFDGNGNLYMLCSNSTAYTLYRINAPVPTTPVAFITVDTVIAQTATPSQAAGAGTTVSITGVAFNNQGKLFISSGSTSGVPNAFHNKLYSMATPGSPLVIVGTLTNGYGDDLTSCTFPLGVLPITWLDFNATLRDNTVKLNWKVHENESTTGYDVQTSIDGSHWQIIAHLDRKSQSINDLNQYSYVYNGYMQGSNYYRIVKDDASGNNELSAIRMLSTSNETKVYLSPNPTSDILNIYHKHNSSMMLAQIYDRNGAMVYSAVITQSQQSISVAQLPRGSYILKLLSSESVVNEKGYQFVKL
jgi:hypothetical protein